MEYENNIIGITQGHRMGLSKLVKIANQQGSVIIGKGEKPEAIIIPLGLGGITKFLSEVEKILDNSENKLDNLSQYRQILLDIAQVIILFSRQVTDHLEHEVRREK